MMVLLVIWGAWFFAADISVRETSENGELTSSRQVTVIFPEENAGQIFRGQTAFFYPQDNRWAQNGPISAQVSRVTNDSPSEGQQVEIILVADGSQAAPLAQGLTGRVEIELEQVSPATLILRNAGMMKQSNSENQAGN